jgi:hypothetical protein
MKKICQNSIYNMKFKPHIDYYSTVADLHKQLKNVFYEMVKLRARSVSISIQCLNADIFLTEHTTSRWRMP